MEDFSTELIKLQGETHQNPAAFDGSTHLQLFLRGEREVQGRGIPEIAEKAGLPDDLLICIEGGDPYGISPSTFEKLSFGYSVDPSLLIKIIKVDIEDGHAVVFEDQTNESNDRQTEENIQ